MELGRSVATLIVPLSMTLTRSLSFLGISHYFLSSLDLYSHRHRAGIFAIASPPLHPTDPHFSEQPGQHMHCSKQKPQLPSLNLQLRQAFRGGAEAGGWGDRDLGSGLMLLLMLPWFPQLYHQYTCLQEVALGPRLRKPQPGGGAPATQTPPTLSSCAPISALSKHQQASLSAPQGHRIRRHGLNWHILTPSKQGVRNLPRDLYPFHWLPPH